MASRHTVADGAWSSVATWDGTTTLPVANDDVTVSHNVTLDVVLPAFTTLTVNNGSLTAPTSTEYFAVNPAIAIETNGVIFAGITTSSAITISDSAAVTFTNVNLVSNAAGNTPTLTIGTGSSLSWSGKYDNNGANMSISGMVTGAPLVIKNMNELAVNGATLAGDITFGPGSVPADASGGGSPPTFNANPFTFRTNSAVSMPYSFTMSGTVNTYDTLSMGGTVTSGGLTVNMMARSVVVNANAITGTFAVKYHGPASGANANMRIGL